MRDLNKLNDGGVYSDTPSVAGTKLPDWMAAGHASDGKADSGKTMMSLLMVQFGDLERQVAEVLTFGESKYPKPITHDSWRDVPEGRRRYIDALYRHLHKFLVDKEELDEESGKHHLAHAMANMHFIYALDKEDN